MIIGSRFNHYSIDVLIGWVLMQFICHAYHWHFVDSDRACDVWYYRHFEHKVRERDDMITGDAGGDCTGEVRQSKPTNVDVEAATYVESGTLNMRNVDEANSLDKVF